MGADRPLFRTDLVSRPVEDAGHRFIEVTDPDSGQSFRFYEVEYAIACAMDGERDVNEIADWARIELGLDPSSDELRTVISTLAELGYLETGARAQEPLPLDRPPPAGRAVVAPPGPALGPSPFDFGMDQPIATPASSELSVDLSEHLPIRSADVQEAVRQSRTMRTARPLSGPPSIDMEGGGDDEFDEQKTPVPMGQPARAPAAAAAGADPFAAARRNTPPPASHLTPAPAVGSAALQRTLIGTGPASPGPAFGSRTPTPPPMVLPEMPDDTPGGGAAHRPTAAARPAAMGRDTRRPMDMGGTPVGARDEHEIPLMLPRRPPSILPYLLVLLLLSGVGAAAYWWFFIREDGAGEGSESVSQSESEPPVAGSAVEPTRPTEQPAATPEPEPQITATLEAGPSEEKEVVAPRAGRVAWLATAGGPVSEGAPVAKFDGFQPVEYAVKEAQDSQRRYQEKLDQATARGDKDAMKEAEGNVKRKQNDIDRHKAELDKFLVKAPMDGLVEPSIKARAQVKKDEPVAKIAVESGVRATFTLPPGTSHAADLSAGEARVTSMSDPAVRATCKVESSEPGKLVVSCPTAGGLTAGSKIVLAK